MSKPKLRFKNDKYKKARGGVSRLLDIQCYECGNHICFYQKDGPGVLKRLYLDRISDDHFAKINSLSCSECKRELGVKYIYRKENRVAFRLFVCAVSKSVKKM